MKLQAVSVLILLLVGTQVQSQKADLDLDANDNLSEPGFEKLFDEKPITDPVEFKKHQEALKKDEKDVKKINEEFEEGKVPWHDAVNEFSDLPKDEFKEEKTGAIMPEKGFGRGLLEPSEEQRVDEESERYFDRIRMDRSYVPESYSSVDAGLVSEVKNQLQCGSCVAFSSIAAVETCFKKVSGVFGDYSEQELVDCGFRQNNANGCHGAPAHAYLKWAADIKLKLAHESQYPYKNTSPRLYCPNPMPFYNQGAQITNSYYTFQGNEELLKKLVYEHGAVVTTVKADGPFQEYKGGIFAGCPRYDRRTDHAITVVGYGSERGIPYWLIKNSWGPTWGEKGFIRLQRGVNMCGIAQAQAVVMCDRVQGPTDAPLTTQKPCLDTFSNCAQVAQTSCFLPHIAKGCAKACGLCPGLTPARSNTCYDKYTNCAQMSPYCAADPNIADGCRVTCRRC